MSEFAGQVAVVTGGAQGLGFAISKLLSERGATVCMLDVDDARLQRAVADLGGDERAQGLLVDVTDESAIQAAYEKIVARHSQVHVLVNNAGIYPHATIEEISVADWDHVFDVNAKSMFLTSRIFMGNMVAHRYGRMVSIVTVDAYKAKPTMPHYAASKASVLSLVRTFAHELGPHQVLVNGVSPGAIATERAKSQSWLKERIKDIPVGRAAEPEDIAEVVLFLASPRNRFVTGETVVASGGAVMV